MNQEEIIKKAAEYLWMNLDMSEEDKEWWIRDFVEELDMTENPEAALQKPHADSTI